MMQFQLLGWGPDLDPSTPGVLVDASGCVASTDGIRPMPSLDLLYASSTAAYARSFAAVNVGDETAHIVGAFYTLDAGTSSTCTLYEFSNAIAVARGTYTASTFTEPVIFRHFDGEMFAAKNGSPMKYAARGGDFTAVTGAPSCSLLEATRDFVIAFDTSTGYDWQTCAIGNSHDWTLSVSNQAVRGELFNKSGRIVATGLFRENLIAFTETQTWIGRYVGAPSVFEWEQIAKDVGCVGPEAVVETPYGICWMSNHDVYIFDGTAPRPLDTMPVRRTMFYELSQAWLKHTQLAWERKTGLLWIYGTPDIAPYSDRFRLYQYSYHFESKKWMPGSDQVLLSAANQLACSRYLFTAAGPVRDDMMGLAYTPGLMTVRAHDGSLEQSGSGSGYFTTGFFGDVEQASMVRSIRPKFIGRDASGTCTASLYTRPQAMDRSTAVTQTVALNSDYAFLFRQTGRWHQAKIYITGNDCVPSIAVDVVPGGRR